MNQTTTGPRLRVLVVDDRRDASLLLKTLLVHAGHDVTTAADGATGLALAQELKPDAVISDLALPGQIDGCDLARTLKSLPASPRLIAMTGYDDDEHRQQAADAGFDHYMVKPAEIDKLLKILSGQ